MPFSNDVTISITPRTQKAPTIDTLEVGVLSGLTSYTSNSILDTSFRVTATVTDEDSEDGSDDVMSTLSGDTSCVVSSTNPVTGVSSLSWTVVINNPRMPLDQCELILSSEANGVPAAETKSVTVTLPELTPSISSIDYTAFAATDTNILIAVSIADIDNDAKFGTATIIGLAGTGSCTLGSFTGANTATQTVNISSAVDGGRCTFKVRVEEDGKFIESATQTITFETPRAPIINSATPNATTSFINEPVTVTVMITDAGDDGLISHSIAAYIDEGASSSANCAVTPNPLVTTGNTASQNFTVASTTAGTCVVNVTSTEGLFTSNNRPVDAITFTERPPVIASVTAVDTNPELGDVEVLVDIVESRENLGIFGSTFEFSSSGTSSCVVTLGGEAVVTVSSMTQKLNAYAETAGTCIVSVNVTRDGVTSANSESNEITFKLTPPNVKSIELQQDQAIANGIDFMVNVTIEDVGLDGVEGDTIALTVDASGTSNCVVFEDTGLPAEQRHLPNGVELVAEFSVSATNGGTCILSATTRNTGAPTPSAAVTETIKFESAPSITTVLVDPVGVVETGTNGGASITVSIEDTDSDTLSGADVIVATAGISGCKVNEVFDLKTFDAASGNVQFRVTSENIGACVLDIKAREDGVSTDPYPSVGVITFRNPVAPRIDSVDLNPNTANVGIGTPVTATVTISDTEGDGLVGANIIATTSGGSGCTLGNSARTQELDGSSNSAVFTINAASAGECSLSVTATEGTATPSSYSGSPQIITFFQQLAPRIEGVVIKVGEGPGELDNTNVETAIGARVRVNVSISDIETDNVLSGATVRVQIVDSGVNPNCQVEGRTPLFDLNADKGFAVFVINSDRGLGTCELMITASEDGIPSDAYTPNPVITFGRSLVTPNVNSVALSPATAEVGQPITATVTITDGDRFDGFGDTTNITVTASNCLVGGGAKQTLDTTSNTKDFIITATAATMLCTLTVIATEDGSKSTEFIRRAIEFTEPAPVVDGPPPVLAWSDQVHESPFNGYMSIGNAGTASDTFIPKIRTAQTVNTRFTPATIGSRLAMVQTRFRSSDLVPVDYGETKFALSDGELGSTNNVVRHFLVQVERTEYVSIDGARDTLLFYADTNSNHFDTTLLSSNAQDALTAAGIGRYLRFTTIAPDTGSGTVKSGGNVRSVTTIPFAATYDNINRHIQTENNANTFKLPGTPSGDAPALNVSRYAGVTDLININVSNVPVAGAKISATMCRLDGFNGADLFSTNCASNSFANAAEIKNILLLGGYWDREPYTSCEAMSAPSATTDFYGWYKNKKMLRDDYYCTATTTRDVPVVPKTLISGATHEKTLDGGSGNTTFPMHIRQFMNTLPDTEAGDDYSLNEKNGYYLITIQAQNSSGTKIGNELKMLFHIGWEFP